MSDFEYVKTNVSREDLLLQLAEEAAELAQAALKIARYEKGTNPTTKPWGKCFSNLIEETADVEVCMCLLGMRDSLNASRVSKIMSEKIERWANRL